MSAEIDAIWARVEVWLATHRPDLLATLRTGATHEAIADAEQALAISFPADVRSSFLRHDGQVPYPPLGLVDGWELLALERLRDEWSVWNDLRDAGEFDDIRSAPEGPIRAAWWSPAWIPLTYDGEGNHACLDLAPLPGGHVGQIIMMWHDAPERTVAAPGYTAWLAALADDLEAGRVAWD